jgi:hypothetical protein
MSVEPEVDVTGEAEEFAYGSSLFGGRPTFGLTRRLKPDSGLTLYELVPNHLADGRRRRFHRSNATQNPVRISLREAFPTATEDVHSEVMDFSSIGSSPERTPTEWAWDDWCALKIAELSGNRQQAIHTLIRDVLDDDGVNHRNVTTSEGSVLVSEATGVRLTLTFLGMRRLQRYEKLTAVADSIARMSLEECYYWHAKCRSPSSPNGVKALRVLLADHIN